MFYLQSRSITHIIRISHRQEKCTDRCCRVCLPMDEDMHISFASYQLGEPKFRINIPGSFLKSFLVNTATRKPLQVRTRKLNIEALTPLAQQQCMHKSTYVYMCKTQPDLAEISKKTQKCHFLPTFWHKIHTMTAPKFVVLDKLKFELWCSPSFEGTARRRSIS